MKPLDNLYKELNYHLKELKHNKTILESTKSNLLQYMILRGETQRIFMGETDVKDLERRTLILLSDELWRATNHPGLSPYGYFSDKDIDFARTQKVPVAKTSQSFPITLHNVIRKDENTFIAFVSAKDIVSLYNSNLFEYNYNVSGHYKLVRSRKGKLNQAIDLNMREVKEIADKIIHNNYNMNKIILNVLVGSGADKEIEFANNVLTIFDSQVGIVSGLHDLSALAYVVEENPQTELKVEIEIKHYNLSDIKDFFNKINVKGGVN